MGRGHGGFVARHRVRIASVLVIAAGSASLIAYAVSVRGFATHHPQLNDGGIWVTRGQHSQFGRLNKPINQLDGFVFTPDNVEQDDLDVLQDGAAVVGLDAHGDDAYPIDGSGLATLDKSAVQLPANGSLKMGGGVLALLDPAKGAVRAVTYDPQQELVAIDGLASPKPLALVGADAALAVGVDGTIYAASGSGSLTTIRLGANGTFAKPTHRQLPGLLGKPQLTVVGDEPVVFSTEPNTSRTEIALPNGRSVVLPAGADVTPQEAGPATASVLAATGTDLWSVPLTGGKPVRLTGGGGGRPAPPVQLRGCVFAAWAGNPAQFGGACGGQPVRLQSLRTPATQLKFRQNHQQVMLNDVWDGNTWNLDTGSPQQVANWNVTKPQNTTSQKPTKPTNLTGFDRPKPPELHSHDFGARPGKTTSLYVLDFANDPSGEVMAVDHVTAKIAAQQSWFSVSPDGQAVDIAVPPGSTASTAFSYTVRTPKGGESTGDDTVTMRTESENANPVPRHGWVPAKDRPVAVPAGGIVTTPVLQNWRDYDDGDPVIVTKASVEGGDVNGTVSVTPDGQLVYTSPTKSGSQTIDYTIGDGRGGEHDGTVKVVVQGIADNPVPAVANPDYARGQVGSPITISPLDNDLPGSDPTSQSAVLRIAAAVANRDGANVQTDLTAGTVTVTPAKPGILTLDYRVAYGDAPLGASTITVRVDPASAARKPVTAPDVAVLHGQQPVNVDVLANDSDPSGNLLVVQSATPQDENQLSVAVLQGRFLEIVPKQPHLTPATQSIQYTVTDGVTGSVSGDVTVTQLDDPKSDTPITIDDYATVRGGSAVAIPVLDNDSTPAGDPLTLEKNVAGAPGPGRLPVTPAQGSAFVSGQLVRYTAPVVTRTTVVDITYQATTASGDVQAGHALVTVTPPPNPQTNPNQTPTPVPIDVRVVAGDKVRIKVPTTGIDPDGDPASVTGVGSGQKLGRVTGFGAGSIDYESYPSVGNGGTDTFTYTIADTLGASAVGLVRVAVVPPGDPQPPIAVNDTLTVAPGAKVRLDVLANDFVAAGDDVVLEDPKRTNPDLAGVTLEHATGPLVITASANPKYHVHFRYTISDGRHDSSAYVNVYSQPGTNLPPVAFDQYARPGLTATTATVDLLAHDFDPDSSDALTVVAPATALTGKLAVTLRPTPQVIPYVIRDAHGGEATAVVYVPAIGGGAPYGNGKHVTLPVKGTKTIDIADYVTDPAHRSLHVTTANTISKSPINVLQVSPPRGGTQLTLQALGDYAGPAAVTFQVTDGSSLTAKGAQQAYVTVPVDIGSAAPVLRCPATVIKVIEGAASQPLHIASICHVWTANAATADRLTFAGKLTPSLPHVSVAGSHSSTLQVVATAGAKPLATSKITLTVDGYAHVVPQTLAIQVVKAPPPTVDPIVIDNLNAGTPKTVDVAQYVHSAVHGPISIVGQPSQLTSLSMSVTASGTRLTIKPGKDTHGTARYSIIVTDEPDKRRHDHDVTGQITVHVLGHPDVPTGVQAADRTVRSNEVHLRWTPPAANGSPITGYTAVASPGGSRTNCGVAPRCVIGGLKNGSPYTFRVIATNAVGPSPASAPSAPITPDRVPDPVKAFTASQPGDGQLTLTWAPDTGDFSTVKFYQLSWAGSGPQRVSGASAHTFKATGLVNDTNNYDFTIVAWNAKGQSTAVHATGLRQSGGTPETPPQPTVTVENDLSTNARVVNLDWGPGVDPNGPKPVRYTVKRVSPSGTTLLCQDVVATTCRDSGVALDGTIYQYSVAAANGYATAGTPRFRSPYGPTTTVDSSAQPDQFPPVTFTATGNEYTANLKFDAPPSHGKEATIQCTVNGSACSGFTHASVPVGGAQGLTDTITGLTPGQNSTITLTECNGSSGSNFAGDKCRSSDPASTVAYGPIKALSVDTSVAGDGHTVNWSVSVNPNGKSATVHVTSNHGLDQTFTTGVGGWSQGGAQDVGYSQTETISVTVSDSGRNTVSGNHSSSTPPPPPSVSLSQGGSTTRTDCPSNCYLFHEVFNNFPAGTYTYQCNNAAGDNWYQGSFYVSGSGASRDGPCYSQHNYYMPVSITILGVPYNGGTINVRSNNASW